MSSRQCSRSNRSRQVQSSKRFRRSGARCKIRLFRNQTGRFIRLSIVLALRSLVDDDTIVACDMGSMHIWMARHFFEFEPRKLLFSNGQQTLGVGIPWAMAASFCYPAKKTVAVVGDAGFLYSSMELETAVRSKLNITVIVFRDGGYNMVAFQEQNMFGRPLRFQGFRALFVKFIRPVNPHAPGSKAFRVLHEVWIAEIGA